MISTFCIYEININYTCSCRRARNHKKDAIEGATAVANVAEGDIEMVTDAGKDISSGRNQYAALQKGQEARAEGRLQVAGDDRDTRSSLVLWHNKLTDVKNYRVHEISKTHVWQIKEWKFGGGVGTNPAAQLLSIKTIEEKEY